MKKSVTLLAVVSLFAACAEKPVEQRLLGQVVQPVMIGASLQYLESLTGPPLNLSFDGGERVYMVDGCSVTAAVGGDEHKLVTSLRLEIAQGCDVDVGKFLPHVGETEAMLVSEMTYGSFDALIGGEGGYFADCLSGCGNAAEPLVYRHWLGARSDDFLEVKLEVALVEDATLVAAGLWRKAMEKAEGEDWVIDTKFNCAPQKYGDVARQAFATIQPQAITIGRDLVLPVC